jgi:pilus assembly protein CpaB
MRRSSLIMLAAAIVLGLAAVFFARMFLVPSQTEQQGPAVSTVAAVVAAKPFAFGEKIVPEKLKVVQWPANGMPGGTFQRIADAVGEGDRVALRAIDANELFTDKSISGKNSRLSTSTLLGPTMRAVAIPLNEVAGAGGFIAPGDRVDVYVTKTAEGDDLPYTDQLMQAVRVLAVGQDSNVGKDKADVVKTATIEVTPLQAQKIALAQNIGILSVSLRNLADESRVRLETAQVLDLNDGTVTRVVQRPRSEAAAPARAPDAPPAGNRAAAAANGPVVPSGPMIEIYRGTKPTSYPVPSGS